MTRSPAASPIETDALIIGAGPVGLFQVFELGLLEIRAHVIDSLPYPGGQCVELYADKPIYDIPGTPKCTGRELVDSLLLQGRPFEPCFHLSQEVTALQKQEDGRFYVETSRGARFVSKTIFIAAGVGAFQPKLLRVDGLEAYLDKQFFYHLPPGAAFSGKRAVVVGGGDSALEAAFQHAQGGAGQAASVTLIHRRDGFQASAANVARLRALCDENKMRFVVGQVTGIVEQDGKLAGVQVADPNGAISQVPLDVLVVLQGLSPKLGPVADWGLAMERRQVAVDTERFSTSVPGIFAVGDINTYPGKKKLILSGFHECALAAFGAAPLIFPDKRIQLQYTTTSTALHKALGVEPTPD